MEPLYGRQNIVVEEVRRRDFWDKLLRLAFFAGLPFAVIAICRFLQ